MISISDDDTPVPAPRKRNRPPPKKKPSVPKHGLPSSADAGDIFDRSASTLTKAMSLIQHRNDHLPTPQLPPSAVTVLKDTVLTGQARGRGARIGQSIVLLSDSDSDNEQQKPDVAVIAPVVARPRSPTPPPPSIELETLYPYIPLDEQTIRLRHALYSQPPPATLSPVEPLVAHRRRRSTVQAATSIPIAVTVATASEANLPSYLLEQYQQSLPDFKTTLGHKDVFDVVIGQYAKHFQLAKSQLVLAYKGWRVSPWSTPAALDMGMEETLQMFLSKDSFERWREQEEAAAAAALAPPTPTASLSSQAPLSGTDAELTSSTSEQLVRLKVRDASGLELKACIRSNAPLSTLIDEFLRKHPSVDAVRKYKLRDPDGDDIAATATCATVGLSDEEMITIEPC
ncbi:hypothetical protein RI367_002875 [Sorochytrium milnesiophthora]